MEPEKQNKLAEEQKEVRCDERVWLDASFVNNENCKGGSGDALDIRNSGIGSLL